MSWRILLVEYFLGRLLKTKYCTSDIEGNNYFLRNDGFVVFEDSFVIRWLSRSDIFVNNVTNL